MSEVQRICPQCAAVGELNSRYCAQCGHDFQGELPAMQSTLPETLGRAAVPVLVGAASIALRLGWKVLQSRWAQSAAEKAVDAALSKTSQAPSAPQQPLTPRQEDLDMRPRRSIRIRSAWSVSDASGAWRHGFSEHRIDIDD